MQTRGKLVECGSGSRVIIVIAQSLIRLNTVVELRVLIALSNAALGSIVVGLATVVFKQVIK